ncbi:MAG: methylmalonyl-CoA mutase [Bacteroidota bacterium]|nr:methylmalonyl-CoA mutase [Bacteroidota bacterium]
MNNNIKFDEFHKPDYNDWKKASVEALKGADFDKKLFNQLYEGITLKPIYNKSENEDSSQFKNQVPGFYPFIRGCKPLGYKSNSWQISQSINESNPIDFNKAATKAVENGQTAISIYIKKSISAGNSNIDVEDRAGLNLQNIDDFKSAFDNFPITDIPLHFHAGISSLSLLAAFIAFCRKSGISSHNIKGSLNFDPLGFAAISGNLHSKENAFDEMAVMTKWAAVNMKDFRIIGVDGSIYRDSGANSVQEIAFMLSTGVEYLKELNSRQINIDTAAGKIRLITSTGGNFFVEIAKLRALRALWSKIIRLSVGNAESQKAEIHVKSTMFNKSALDIHTNMLRNTGEAMAAIIGGCNSLEIEPFDKLTGKCDEFSLRSARNNQLVLLHESHLANTADPAGGSYFIECLTDSIARHAWDLFRTIESRGGKSKSLETGFIQELVSNNSSEMMKNFSTRKDVLVGVNKYPNKNNSILSKLTQNDTIHAGRNQKTIDSQILEKLHNPETIIEGAIEAAESGYGIIEINKFLHSNPDKHYRINPIRNTRLAEMFEKLHENAEIFKEKTGTLPQVLIIPFGQPKEYKARVDFSTEFLAVGGFQIYEAAACDSIDEAIKTSVESGKKIIIICSSDDKYPLFVPELSRKIKSASKGILLVLAGFPSEFVDDFKASGINEFIHIKADIYGTLGRIQEFAFKAG